MAKCDCYFQHGTKFLCYGTKEMEECSCGGDESKCNFYPEKRKLKMANEKRLIDANALIEALPIVTEDRKITLYGAVSGFMIMISAMPTVDAVEVVHGRWEWITEDIYGCTNCGATNHVKEVMGQPDYHYCPNCGANMMDLKGE